MIIIIAGPSGAGKTSLCNLLLEGLDNLVYSVSATTRKKRSNEINGRNYRFLSEEEFNKWRKEGKFLETAKVHDYYYGTIRDEVLKSLRNNKDVIVDIDVQGTKSVKEKMDNVVSIFVLPPNLEEASRRIKERGVDNNKSIKNRISNAEEEIKEIHNFDYVVVNDDLNECARIIQSIIIAERHSIVRMEV